MLWRSHFDVLLVDDEPDILTVTKLALKHVTFFGIPLKIHTAESKAQAIELLEKTKVEIALAFIDVIMETDNAGLELCEHIREKLHDHAMQLYIRTGQAALAPEKSVVDRYDISGYLTKAEATEGKLYSVVKTALKQWCFARFALESVEFLKHVVPGCVSPVDLIAQLGELHKKEGEAHYAWFIEGQVGGWGKYADTALAQSMRDTLRKSPPIVFDETGSELFRSGRDILLRLGDPPPPAPAPTAVAQSESPSLLGRLWKQLGALARPSTPATRSPSVELLITTKHELPEFVLKPTLALQLSRMGVIRSLLGWADQIAPAVVVPLMY